MQPTNNNSNSISTSDFDGKKYGNVGDGGGREPVNINTLTRCTFKGNSALNPPSFPWAWSFGGAVAVAAGDDAGAFQDISEIPLLYFQV